MPNTIPSSAAPNSTIRPASIVNRNSLRIRSSCRNPFQPLARNDPSKFFRQSRGCRQTNEQIYATEMRRNSTDPSRGLPLSGVYCSKGKRRVGSDFNGAIRRARERRYAGQRTLSRLGAVGTNFAFSALRKRGRLLPTTQDVERSVAEPPSCQIR
jgi:hypothetical protein